MKKDNHLIQLLIEQFALRFGGMDYWQLSKFWKRVVYKEVAKTVIWVVREYDKEHYEG